jgi:hypothetical protein
MTAGRLRGRPDEGGREGGREGEREGGRERERERELNQELSINKASGGGVYEDDLHHVNQVGTFCKVSAQVCLLYTSIFTTIENAI